MQPHEVQAMAISNEKAIAALDARVDGITQRVLSLEKTNSILEGVQIALERFALESKYSGEKIDELKQLIRESNAENKKQHEEINSRVLELESKPGKRWETVVGDFIKILIAGGLGYFLAQFGLK